VTTSLPSPRLPSFPYPPPRDATSTWVVNMATYGLFVVRRASVWLMHPRLGRVGRLLSAPLRLVAAALQRPLNKVLLLGVEVAMEYLMGLTSSPYVQWLQVGLGLGLGVGLRVGLRVGVGLGVGLQVGVGLGVGLGRGGHRMRAQRLLYRELGRKNDSGAPWPPHPRPHVLPGAH
jgi:hypothetical protein